MPALLSPSLPDVIVKQDREPLAMKRCSKCKEVLPFALFNKHKRNKNGMESQCKSCRSKYHKISYKNGGMERMRNYRKNNPVKAKTIDMFCKARQRAKEKNVPFDIDIDYVRSLVGENAELAVRCPVLGFLLDYSTQRTEGTGHALPNSPSIDRIVPELGYVKGNVRIISHRANTIKSNASVQELKLVLADVTMLGIDWDETVGINTEAEF